MNPSLSRRQLLRLGAGAVVVVGLGACDSRAREDAASTTSTPSPTGGTGTAPGSTAPDSTGPGAALFGGRRLVVVQLNGGNDGLNTLPPADPRYHDLRPTLAVADAERVALPGVGDVALHPSLAGLVPLFQAGHLAFVQGIGFSDPDRSHFVSMDRWWYADQLGSAGWLGRVLDGLARESTPLFATAIGSTAPALGGATVQPTTIITPASFRFEGVQPEWLSAMGEGGDGLPGALRHAYARAVQGVADFASLTGADEASGDLPEREGGASLAAGLGVAAQMLASDVGTQLVVVSASGFDTHANQAAVQQSLLKDLSDGLVAFQAQLAQHGLADDVLLVTTSEFGRRVAENGSGGTDHGAGGLSLVLGAGVKGGLYGEVDLGNLLDGDVRPVIDPRALYTQCLDWLGQDAAKVLGRRYDGLSLLAS